jgi:transglutaminase-like putative cysteine protease
VDRRTEDGSDSPESSVTLGGRREYGRAVLVVITALALVVSAATVPVVLGDGSPPALSMAPLQPSGAGGAGQAAQAAQAAGVAGSLSGSGLGALSAADTTTVGGLTSPGSLSDSPLRNQSSEVHFVVRSTKPTYWRTGAYSQYTGQGWERSGSPEPFNGTFPEGELRGQRVSYEVTLEQSATALPTAWRPARVNATEGLRIQPGTSLSAIEPRPAGTTYQGVSYSTAREPSVLRAAGRSYPEQVRSRYLGLPDANGTRRLAAFTDELTANVSNPYDTAVVIEQWLEANKEYSLEATHDPEDGTVASQFVFEMETGYCEYFATAMVAMLRSQDIPARYVVGYSTGQKTGQKEYTVRAMNAHAWVEVYFPDVGWVRFDPTPGQQRLASEQRAFANQTGASELDYAPSETGSPGESFTPNQTTTADGAIPDGLPRSASGVNGTGGAGNVSTPNGSVANGTNGSAPPSGLTATPNGTAGQPPPTPGSVPNGTAAGTPGDVPGGASGENGTTGGTPGGTPAGVPNGTETGSPGTPAGTPGETPDGTPAGTPGGTPAGTPDGAPGGTNGTAGDGSGGDGTDGDGTDGDGADDGTDGDGADDSSDNDDETSDGGEGSGDGNQSDGPPPLSVSLNRSAVPGATVRVTVTRGGDPESGVRVRFNGEVVGTTGADGTVVATVPYTATLNVTVTDTDGPSAWLDASTAPPVRQYSNAPPVRQYASVPPDSDENSTTYPLETRASVSVVGDVRSNGTVTVVATVEDVPVRQATVLLDGEEITETDRRGRATVRLPSEPGNHTVSVRRGAVGGNTTVEIHTLNATADVGWLLALPFAPVTITTTLGPESVDGATVTLDGRSLGTTGVDGTLETRLPVAPQATLTVRKFGQETTVTITGIYRTLGTLAGGIVALLALLVVFGYRRGIRPGDFPAVVSHYVTLLQRGVLTAILAVAAYADRAGDALLEFFEEILSGSLTLDEIPGRLAEMARTAVVIALAGIAAYLLDLYQRLRKSLPFVGEEGSLFGEPEAGGDGEESSPQAQRLIREAWRRFLGLLTVQNARTRTPAEVAEWAIEHDGLPSGPVERLRDAFRAVEYGEEDGSGYVESVSAAWDEVSARGGGEMAERAGGEVAERTGGEMPTRITGNDGDGGETKLSDGGESQ